MPAHGQVGDTIRNASGFVYIAQGVHVRARSAPRSNRMRAEGIDQPPLTPFDVHNNGY